MALETTQALNPARIFKKNRLGTRKTRRVLFVYF
ncbi:MAG: hypothetical protein ACI9UN_005532 [Granulosicoccus sp.]